MWQELEAPYEAARTRVLVGRACGELGDVAEAEMSLGGAAAVFERLSAAPDRTLVEELRARTLGGSRTPEPLGPRADR
jgi:hypothetical protein